MGLHGNGRKTASRGARNHLAKFQPSPVKRWRHQEERPVQRNTANARERARMKVLSCAFHRLKTCLPWVPTDTKLSKLDTLRLASAYIAHLLRVLREEDDAMPTPCRQPADVPPHPVALTWPFLVNSRSTFSDCPSQDACRLTAADDSDYRNLVPCEYQAIHCNTSHFAQQ